MTIELDVQYASDFVPCPDASMIEQWVSAALANQQENGELSIKIVDEAEMAMLNFDFRKKQKPTNVLSFPCQLPEPMRGDMLGDIAICAPVVNQEAIAQGKPLFAHFAHMVIHGVLHLLGFDHENDEDATKMEALEVTILKTLGFADPYGVHIVHD
ncbi:MAG TPA: rRNA maturation RNase YbeY [Candidatus Berkiella sp.]|nr:rRNA maturation RNase YbeY [Candidatus Berkiella sp.]